MISWRNILALLFVNLFLLSAVWQFSIVSYYFLNQEEITAKHCVNKDKPELNCKGKCHITKLLTGQEKKVGKAAQTKSSTWLLVFQAKQNIQKFKLLSLFKNNLQTYHTPGIPYKGYGKSIFTPPEEQLFQQA